MKNTIKKILDKQKAAQTLVTECKEAIIALQALCEHSWSHKGHSHNDDLYICSECGKEEWR